MSAIRHCLCVHLLLRDRARGIAANNVLPKCGETQLGCCISGIQEWEKVVGTMRERVVRVVLCAFDPTTGQKRGG